MERCIALGTPEERSACGAILDCGTRNHCIGQACYCGSDCLFPNGPCVREVRAATGMQNPTLADLLAAFGNEQTALGRAQKFNECITTWCSNECVSAPTP